MVRTRRKTEPAPLEEEATTSKEEPETQATENAPEPAGTVRRSGRARKLKFLETPSELLGVKSRRGSKLKTEPTPEPMEVVEEPDIEIEVQVETQEDEEEEEEVTEPEPESVKLPEIEREVIVQKRTGRGRPRKKPQEADAIFDQLKLATEEQPPDESEETDDLPELEPEETPKNSPVNKAIESVRESDADSTPSPRRRSRRFNLAKCAENLMVTPEKSHLDDEEDDENEELIEIVVEEQSSNESEEKLEENVELPADDDPVEEDTEISYEVIEDSNDVSTEGSKPVSPVIPAADEVEDEVSIVYLDENDTILSETSRSDVAIEEVTIESDSEASTADNNDVNQAEVEDCEILDRAVYVVEENVATVQEIVAGSAMDTVIIEAKEVESLGREILNVTLEESHTEESQEEESKSADVSQDDEEMEAPDDPHQAVVDESANIRRSRRIKKIIVRNKRSVGHGLVKDRDAIEKFMPEKPVEPTPVQKTEEEKQYERETEARLKKFVNIKDNEYKCDKNVSKEAKKMLCDCFLTEEEYNRGELGCGEDCLNRLLMIECGPKCNVGSRCTNKRFQTANYAGCKVFRTEMKGFGIQAATPIAPGEFIMEYVGEVLDSTQFETRAADYSLKENKHYYFMALRSDAVIDATTRGNISRFINHSCDPNAETQKWTVNGELRIGFFSTKYIVPGEEITFDYQFQRYGKEAQKCYCEAANCRGWIGKGPGDEDSEESISEGEEEDDEEEEGEEPPVPNEDASQHATQVEKRPKKPQRDKTFKIKIERKKRVYRRRKQRQEFLDDLDLDDEINILSRTGLKNQQHTLKLSRLMVRAELMDARSRLLSLLKEGELPCRRLFLDYHGLRILHGWMEESRNIDPVKDHKFKKAILDVLEVLPIGNKTTLKDSKVLSLVQKWAEEFNPEAKVLNVVEKMETETVGNDSSSASGDATPSISTPSSFDPGMFKNIPDIISIEKLKQIINTCDKNKTEIESQVKEPEETSIEKSQETEETATDFVSETIAQDKSEEPENETTSDEPDQEVHIEVTSEIESENEVKLEVDVEQANVDQAEVEVKMEESDAQAEVPGTVDVIETKVDEGELKAEDTKVEVEEPEQPKTIEEVVKTDKSEEATEKSELELIKQEIFELASKLLTMWENLKEVFRIPKKERIEQMKNHEREADLRYQSLKQADEEDKESRYLSRYRDRERAEKRQERPIEPPTNPYYKDNRSGSMKRSRNMSKQERRRVFEMQVAKEEATKREQELWFYHEQNCLKFGLNPQITAHTDVPAMMNPITGQYFSPDRRPLPTPPSHQYMKIIPPPLSTDPADYELPPMNLPPLWKFAIDERGHIYYYHVKIRIPQWNPPIQIQPLHKTKESIEESLSEHSDDSSTTDTKDSEEEDLEEKLEILKKCKEKGEPQFNLDDLLTKPGDLDDDLETTGTDDNLLAQANAKVKTDILNTAPNFTKSLDTILPNLKRIQRKRSGLVQERPISPRTQEDKILGKIKMQQYRETKEKLRRRKREAKKRQQMVVVETPTTSQAITQETTLADGKPKIVDELDIIQSGEVKKPSVYEEWKKQEEKMTMEKRRNAEKTLLAEQMKKRKKQELIDLSSKDARKIKDKFRSDISGIIKQQLNTYRSELCDTGRITNDEDYKHLARKLTHFVMLKELKHCGNSIGELVVSESVKIKAREFVKKYMAKYGSVYIRPDDEPDFKE